MKLWIVSPVYNEERGILEFIRAIEALSPKVSPCSLQLVLVDDGSSDGTAGVIESYVRKSGALPLHFVQLSRNFGQQSALHAGLSYVQKLSADDDLFLIMDSDLEHPPEKIPDILVPLTAKEVDHVQMLRRDEGELPFFKSTASHLFYLLFRKLAKIEIPAGSSDFRAFNRQVLDAFLSLTEVDRFNRGIFWWVGFRRLEMEYSMGKRHAGETHYSLSHMFRLCLTALTSFSSKPLLLINSFVLLSALLGCFFYLSWELYRIFFLKAQFVFGWPTMMFMTCFWGAALALGQLVLSVYVSKLFTEMKGRPSFIIRRVKTTELNSK